MDKTPVSSLRALAVALTVAASCAGPAAARSGAARSAAAPVPAASTVDACAWDRPGNDPFMGDVVAAVDRYHDIAVDVRTRLKARMVMRDYDDVVSIRRDSITGRARVRYGTAIHDMHFGNAKLCRSVSRAAWSAQMQERGLVYCESDQCILVPTVCRNVSRIARAGVAPAHAEGDVPDLEPPPVAALDLLPAPVPFDVSPPALSLDASSGVETPPAGYSPGVGFAGAGAGGSGSFAAGSAGASGLATIAAASGHGDGLAPGSSALLNTTISPVPEPGTWALMAAGLAGLADARRRRRK
ncbi:MAG: MHFG family PEP-CTERM protein [Caldimonas sp.]